MSIGEHIDGWMSPEELKWLYATAQEMESIVEVGSWMGRSTYALCSGCKGVVYAVDHFLGSSEHQDEIQQKNLNVFGEFLKNTHQFKHLFTLKTDSTLAARHFKDGSVDMVFIDAAHEKEWVLRDLKAWAPKTRKLLCGHDRHHHEVEMALDEYFGKGKWGHIEGLGIWIVQFMEQKGSVVSNG